MHGPFLTQFYTLSPVLCNAHSHQPLISILQPLQHGASRLGCSPLILYSLQALQEED